MPWLMDQVEEQLEQVVLARTVVDSIIRNVVQNRTEEFGKLDESLRQEVLAKKAAQALEERVEPQQNVAANSNNVQPEQLEQQNVPKLEQQNVPANTEVQPEQDDVS